LQRLRTRAEFQSVLAGKIVAKTPHFALHMQNLGQVQPCIGAVLPKRWARRAVTRNAMKRQIWNVAGSFALRMPVQAYVVRLRTGFDQRVFVSACSDALKTAIRLELQTLFESACRHSLLHPTP
jgi:ribonuclease P protein component